MSQSSEQILKALRHCKTVSEVDAAAAKYKGTMQAMKADPKLAIRIIHIRNLASHLRKTLK